MVQAFMNETIVTIYGRPEYDAKNDPQATSDIQDEGLYGMPITLIEPPNEGWVKIKTHYGYSGYVPLTAIYCTQRVREKVNLRFVKQAYADVLNLPKVQGVCLQQVTRGAILEVVDEPALIGWSRVRLNDGRMGYIKSHFLIPYVEGIKKGTSQIFREQVVATAKLYLGTQYRWGGKSPLGIDCSGLCSMVYLLNGICIYRDAKIMPDYPVHKIPYEQKDVGDLLYFPGHMALYLGHDLYIHATAKIGSDGVVINSLEQHSPLYREDLKKSLSAVGSIF